MRSLEQSFNKSIDQTHVADDRNRIETRKHGGGTTWDDIANLKDQMGKLHTLIDELPTQGEENETAEQDRSAAMERIENLRISDDELIELTSEWKDVEIDQEALREATKKNGNPNIYGKGLFFSSGNLPMSDESVYRHVGSSAIADLMVQGFVRNKREAADALNIPGKKGFGTVGPGVYWYNGDSSKREKADMVIQATKNAAERGYVTKDDVQGIWVTDRDTGRPVNLIDGQDHTGLKMANHKP